MDKTQDIVIIVQRLTGTHQDNIGNPFSGVLLHKQNLIQNFTCGQAANQSADAGGTEFTAHAAADL